MRWTWLYSVWLHHIACIVITLFFDPLETVHFKGSNLYPTMPPVCYSTHYKLLFSSAALCPSSLGLMLIKHSEQFLFVAFAPYCFQLPFSITHDQTSWCTSTTPFNSLDAFSLQTYHFMPCTRIILHSTFKSNVAKHCISPGFGIISPCSISPPDISRFWKCNSVPKRKKYHSSRHSALSVRPEFPGLVKVKPAPSLGLVPVSCIGEFWTYAEHDKAPLAKYWRMSLWSSSEPNLSAGTMPPYFDPSCFSSPDGAALRLGNLQLRDRWRTGGHFVGESATQGGSVAQVPTLIKQLYTCSSHQTDLTRISVMKHNIKV